MTGRIRTIILALVACAFLALVAGFVERATIERLVFTRQAQGILGTDVDVTSAHYASGMWTVAGLVVGPSSATPVALTASAATIRLGDRPPSVSLAGATLTIADPHASIAGLDDFERAFPHAEVRVRDGRVALGGVDLVSIDGTLHFGANAVAEHWPSFDGTLALRQAGSTYPIALRASRPDGGDQMLTAAALPAAAFAPPYDEAEMKPVGGMLRDVDVEISHGVRGTARLDDVTFALYAHHLHGLHGTLAFGDGGLGSKKLAGFLDAVPFDATGEVHDLPEPYAWVTDGSRDLRAFAKLIREIADEPALRSVHFDTTAPGLGFALYTMTTDHGPLAINVLTIDPTEPTLRFDTAIAEDHVISNGERTSMMGARTGAVAGVNGDYFDIGRTYQPQGMLERSGEIVRGPVERAAIVIDKSKRVRFDLFHVGGTARIAGRTYPITQINDWPAGEATVITPSFGKTLPAAPGVTFAALAPAGRTNRYRVTSVTAAVSALPVSFGIGFGPATHAAPHAGDIVDLDYRIEPNVDGAVAAIGGGPILVRDGAWFEDAHAPAPDERDYRWPVVALARQADDHLLLVAVDGRHPERSVGMTRPEFADLLIRFGVTDAMALDSGGSVTMVSRAPGDANVSVRNVPSDHSAERWVSDALFIYSSAPPPTIVAPATLATPMPAVRPTP